MDKKDARIIVLGNEKGGTGKSTLAMNIVVGLLDTGKKAAVIDLDARQKSVVRYLQNYGEWRRPGQYARIRSS
jgi:chromosome partitioning protein